MSSYADVPDVIDSHHHLWPAVAIPQQAWRPVDDQAIRRPFEPKEFAEEMVRAGVSGSVLMQSVDEEAENARLFAFSRANPFIRGVVAWAPLMTPPTASESIARLLDSDWTGSGSKLSGVRCLVGTDPMEWALTEEGITMFRQLASAGLAWDTVPITPEQVATICRVAAKVPDLRIVIDHLASPPLTAAGMVGWRERVARLASFDNISIKLSVGVAVLSRWDAWSTRSLLPYLKFSLDAFGPSRSMLASNWPVVLLRTGYQHAWEETKAAVEEHLSETERASVRSGTAVSWYGLEGARVP